MIFKFETVLRNLRKLHAHTLKAKNTEIWKNFATICSFFLKILFIHDSHRERERQRHRQRKKQAPSGEPDVRFNPRTPDHNAQPLSHPCVPKKMLLYNLKLLKLHSPIREKGYQGILG